MNSAFFKQSMLGMGLLSMVVGLISACAPQENVGRRSFMATQVELSEQNPRGLNPLGHLHPCKAAEALPAGKIRLVVASPVAFTSEASEALTALYRALNKAKDAAGAFQFRLSLHTPLSAAEALQLGQGCGATAVLWELPRARILELTFALPPPVPLRGNVPKKLCQYGTYAEQARIVFHTLLGVAFMSKNQHNQAQEQLQIAVKLDKTCLRLQPSFVPLP